MRIAIRKGDALRLALVQFLSYGLLSIFIGLGFEANLFFEFSAVWRAVLYNGIISVGLGFTFQVIRQKMAPETDSAIILSLETVFAAFFGWLLLGEPPFFEKSP